MSRNTDPQAENDTTMEQSADATGYDATTEPERSELGEKMRDMFGVVDSGFESYEALDQHIKRTQISAVIGMVVIPLAALMVVGFLYMVGAQQYAMALAIPLLFVAGISMMSTNIGRNQLAKLKQQRDNWTE